jgi:hypothetical protein
MENAMEQEVVGQTVDTPVSGDQPNSIPETETSSASTLAELLGDEYRDDPAAQKFKDVNGLFKSYKEMEAFRGKQGIIKPNPDDPEDVARFNREIGIPEAPDKYEMEAPPDWLAQSGYNQDFFKQLLHIGGVSEAKANEVQQAYIKFEEQQVQRILAEQKEAAGKAEQELRSKKGEKYEEFVAVADKVVDNFTNGNTELASRLKETLKTDAELRELFGEIGNNFAEHRIGDFEATRYDMSPEAAQKEIDEIKSDLTHPYWSDKDPEAHAKAMKRMEDLYKMAQPRR